MKKPFDRNVWVIAIHDGAGGVDIFCGLNQMQTKAKKRGGQFLFIYIHIQLWQRKGVGRVA